jgi:hypothetical protein
MRYALPVLASILSLAVSSASAQEAARPLVRLGETLTYRVHSARFGNIGTAIMRVEPDTIRGRAAYRLSFEFSAKVVLFKISDKTHSWLDAETMTTLRYAKAERSPIGKRDELSDVFASRGIWSGAKGEQPLASPLPLDELSFIYFVRTVGHAVNSSVNRHFDLARNPVHFRCLGLTEVDALGEKRAAHIIQMDVKDPRQNNGSGTLRFYLSEDEDRLPLRIDSSMPVAGALTLTLTTVSLPQSADK